MFEIAAIVVIGVALLAAAGWGLYRLWNRGGVDKSVAILGNATEGTALFVTGLIVSAQPFKLNWGVGWAVLGKSVIQPALCLAVALLLRMPLEQTRFAVLLSAIPSGFFGILFGKGFDATPEVASSSLVASTVLSIVTLAGWIVLLSHLH